MKKIKNAKIAKSKYLCTLRYTYVELNKKAKMIFFCSRQLEYYCQGIHNKTCLMYEKLLIGCKYCAKSGSRLELVDSMIILEYHLLFKNYYWTVINIKFLQIFSKILNKKIEKKRLFSLLVKNLSISKPSLNVTSI